MQLTTNILAIGFACVTAAAASAQIGQTGVTGTNAPFSNLQPSISIHYYLHNPFGMFGIGVPIRMFAFDYNPGGNWIPCDGRMLQIQAFQGLFFADWHTIWRRWSDHLCYSRSSWSNSYRSRCISPYRYATWSFYYHSFPANPPFTHSSNCRWPMWLHRKWAGLFEHATFACIELLDRIQRSLSPT